MSEKIWGFFPFSAMDYKAAQAYLDKKSADGWILDKIYWKRLARFIPAQGRYHCVDVDTPRGFADDIDTDYVEFCEDAGWELTASIRNMLIFRSKPGQHPAPLQTDKGMEAERFWKKYVRKNVLVTLAVLVVCALLLSVMLLLPGFGVEYSALLLSNAALLLPPIAVLILAYLIWSLCSTVGSYVHFRRLSRLPEHGRPGAWLMGIVSVAISALILIWLCAFNAEDIFGVNRTVDVGLDPLGQEISATAELCQSYPVITAADLGLPYSENSRYLDGRRSLLADQLEYSEITNGSNGVSHILTTMRYQCANEAVAKWMFSARRSETANGVGFIWGKLEWGETTADYGFDQICFARDNSYLLLREGDTVALVGATGFDLTEHLDVLRERLELNI